jgi:hypothetical protein
MTSRLMGVICSINRQEWLTRIPPSHRVICLADKIAVIQQPLLVTL